MSRSEHRVKKRWSPTKEQARILEHLYSTGTHNPTIDQIHLIAAHLQQFGNLEGMNVFYWFKNHKARELRRRKKQCIHIQPRPRTATEESSSSSFSHQTNVVCWFGLEVTSIIAESTNQKKERAAMINGQQSITVNENASSPYLAVGSNIGHGVEKEPLQTLQLFPV
eukprot:Gb_12294 [translate_table: standard]